jgi:Protein of unknown function (DUF2628)
MFVKARSIRKMQWTVSWNWAAFLLTICWLLYRKMYLWVGLWAAEQFTLSVIGVSIVVASCLHPPEHTMSHTAAVSDTRRWQASKSAMSRKPLCQIDTDAGRRDDPRRFAALRQERRYERTFFASCWSAAIKWMYGIGP